MLLTGGTNFGYTTSGLASSSEALNLSVDNVAQFLENAQTTLRMKMMDNSVTGDIVELVMTKFQNEVIKPCAELNGINFESAGKLSKVSELASDNDTANRSVLGA